MGSVSRDRKPTIGRPTRPAHADVGAQPSTRTVPGVDSQETSTKAERYGVLNALPRRPLTAASPDASTFHLPAVDGGELAGRHDGCRPIPPPPNARWPSNPGLPVLSAGFGGCVRRERGDVKAARGLIDEFAARQFDLPHEVGNWLPGAWCCTPRPQSSANTQRAGRPRCSIASRRTRSCCRATTSPRRGPRESLPRRAVARARSLLTNRTRTS